MPNAAKKKRKKKKNHLRPNRENQQYETKPRPCHNFVSRQKLKKN